MPIELHFRSRSGAALRRWCSAPNRELVATIDEALVSDGTAMYAQG
jgi:hypothetical protein